MYANGSKSKACSEAVRFFFPHSYTKLFMCVINAGEEPGIFNEASYRGYT